MTLSVIINTCALGSEASQGFAHNRDTPYGVRRYALANFIIPAYVADPHVSEVIVTGEWIEGDGYTYVPCPSRFFSSDDAVAQRQAGFEASSGDIIVFSHDDHILHPRAPHHFEVFGMEADVVVLGRFVRTMGGDMPLNNGADEGYIGGHCVAYQRRVLNRIPWAAVPPIREWDMAQTMLIREAGFTIAWPSDPRCYDVELGGNV